MRRRRQDLPRQRAPAGLLPCLPPPRLDLAKVEPYDDVLLRLVSYPDEIDVPFRSHQSKKGVGRPNAMEYGITRFDLVAGNNPIWPRSLHALPASSGSTSSPTSPWRTSAWPRKGSQFRGARQQLVGRSAAAQPARAWHQLGS
jgi:hypothetical protein